MTAINIVFDGPPDHEGPRFIEVENDHGQSIRIGEWAALKREGFEDAGYWRLRITLAELVQLSSDGGLPNWPEPGPTISSEADLTLTPKEG